MNNAGGPDRQAVGAFPPCLSVAEDEPVAPILDQLHVPKHRPVLVVVGWADRGPARDTETWDRIELLIRNIVVPACADGEVVVVTGGTSAGVMATIGKAVGEWRISHTSINATTPRRDVTLVGVAPARKLKGLGSKDSDAAEPEQHHSLIATSGAEWGDERHTLVRVAEEIAQNCPVLVLAIGGGSGTIREVTMATRRKWPVLLATTGVCSASDFLASELHLILPETSRKKKNKTGDSKPTDGQEAGSEDKENDSEPREAQEAGSEEKGDDSEPREAQEVGSEKKEDGSVTDGLKLAFSESELSVRSEIEPSRNMMAVSTSEVAAIDRMLRWILCNDDEVLREAWVRFADIDALASARKPVTVWLAGFVVILATLTAIVAVLAAVFQTPPDLHVNLRIALTALPLIAAALLATMERRNRTGSWVENRAEAEAVIREIYLYRARVGDYRSQEGTDRQANFASMLSTIDSGADLLSKGDPSRLSAPWPPDKLKKRIPLNDNLTGELTSEMYDVARAQNQLRYFEKSTKQLSSSSFWWAVGLYVFAGCSAFALTLSWRETWESVMLIPAAVSASFVAALISWREYRQDDQQVTTSLLTTTAVRAARTRWLANSPRTPDSLPNFASEVEAALSAEGSEWTRRIKQAHLSFVKSKQGN